MRNAVDWNTLLPGEPSDSSDRDEVRLWLDVYSELCETLRRLVVLNPSQDVVEHLKQLDARRRFWLGRDRLERRSR